MLAERKFWITEGLILLALGLITSVEAISFSLFNKIFLAISEYVSWFLGLTVGIVVPDMLKRTRAAIGKRIKLRGEPDERFWMFLLNVILFVFIVSLFQKIAITFLRTYFIFFHVIFAQWIVLVYIWFKAANKFPLPLKYLFTTQLIIIISILLVLLTVSP